MAEIRDQTLTGEVALDGNTFINIVFKDARMLYLGGEVPGFDNCAFDNSTFAFDGAAGRTVNFLRSMAPKATNMRQVVLGILPELQD